MDELPKRDEQIKPYQFSLRSLFIVTTILAILLSAAKAQGDAPLAFVLAAILLLPAIPFCVLGLWLMRHGRRRPGIICIGNGVLVVALLLILMEWTNLPQMAGAADAVSLLCPAAAVSILMLPVWIFIAASREEELQEADEARERSEANK